MLNKTGVAVFVAIVLSNASGAFARNQASTYSSPDSTPNGPFIYEDTYGVPPTILRPIHQRRRPSRNH
jgi:hypothetical protein